MNDETRAALVDRVAKALADLAGMEGWNWYTDEDGEAQFPRWDDLSDDDEYMGHESEWPNHGRNHYRKQARAALAAVEPGIDELLDSVSPKANMWTATDPTGGYAASIRFPMVNGEWVTIPATGPTRMAAIQDAVRQATGAEGDEG